MPNSRKEYVRIFAVSIKKIPISKLIILANRIFSKSEIERLNQFTKTNDKKLYIAGKLLTRKAIAKIANAKPSELVFGENKFGRPKIIFPSLKNFDFNLSHSGEWVVLAISDSNVGIDIEKLKPIDTTLVKNLFHKEEMELINTAKEKLNFFYKIWVLKESYIKAIGKGFSHAVNKINFKFDDGRIRSFQRSNLINKNFKIYNFGENYIIALCLEKSKIPPLKIYRYNLNKFL